MFVTLLILLVLAAVAASGYFFARRADGGRLPEHLDGDDAPNFRPLFQPTEEEIRRTALTEEQRASGESAESSRLERLELLQTIRENWETDKNKQNTVRLIEAAAANGDAEEFRNVCDAVVGQFRTGDLAGLSARDLAEAIETHYWLLPPTERTPGTGFILRDWMDELRGA